MKWLHAISILLYIFLADLTGFHVLLLFQIDSHIKRLDEDLNNFAEDLKQGTQA